MAAVFVESNIQTPIQAVFDTPMGAHCFCESFDIVKRCYEMSAFCSYFAAALDHRLDHADCDHSAPLVLLFQAIDIGREVIFAFFYTVMAFFQGLERILCKIEGFIA